ncbi:MAG: AMP-binding protein, partial [Clostridia bacterium]|nr:AMP-binding protein [Clostridia bacterium]
MSTENIYTDSLIAHARRTPDKIAYSEYGGESLSYADLLELVLKNAAAVTEAVGDKDGDKPVAVLVDRGTASVAAMLGINAAGRWYTAVDAELPPERIAFLISLCSPSAVLNASSLPDSAFTSAIDFGTTSSPVFISAEMTKSATPIDVSALPLRDDALPMFGIFTSGSTGTPKLVVKSRRAMSSFTLVYNETFGFDGNEVFGNQIPFYFDASTKDIFSTVVLGATCVTIPAKHFAFPSSLISILNECRITSIVWVPSALSVAAKFNVFAVSKPEYLKKILFVGEKMPVKYLNVWRAALPDALFVNLYGSTEVAGNSCYYIVDRDFGPAEILPIGKPFAGTRVFIIDPETGRPSDEGELCVSGPGLADGYYGSPEKTAAVFRDTVLPDFSGRLYYSGDYGKTDGNGNLVCVSRRDSQIKHMGHRIELGEIEAAVLSVGGVGEAVCLYDAENEKIVLFYSAASDISRDVRRSVAEKLPKYMIRHSFLFRPELPQNRNGKLDRAGIA